MDLDRVLEALDVRIEPLALCEVHGTQALGLGCQPRAVLHYVLGGAGRIKLGRDRAIDVGEGSVALIPAYQTHGLVGLGGAGNSLPDCKPLAAGMQHFKSDGGAGTLSAICGRVEVAVRGVNGAFDVLRAPLIERLPPGDRVRNAFEELIFEMSNPGVGTRALVRSILEQCVILLLRRRHEAGDPTARWIRGSADEGLWPVMQVILDKPMERHSVESLARQANMSRSVFARRFHDAYGVGPMDLVRSVRLRRAAELLQGSTLPVKRIAELVGYKSRTYFSRAFEAQFGASPKAYRHDGNYTPAEARRRESFSCSGFRESASR